MLFLGRRERTFKNNTSFVSRFSTRRRDRSSTAGSLTSRDGIGSQAQSPMSNRQGSRRAALSTSEEEVPNVLDRWVHLFALPFRFPPHGHRPVLRHSGTFYCSTYAFIQLRFSVYSIIIHRFNYLFIFKCIGIYTGMSDD